MVSTQTSSARRTKVVRTKANKLTKISFKLEHKINLLSLAGGSYCLMMLQIRSPFEIEENPVTDPPVFIHKSVFINQLVCFVKCTGNILEKAIAICCRLNWLHCPSPSPLPPARIREHIYLSHSEKKE
jgi:hypothetical protein